MSERLYKILEASRFADRHREGRVPPAPIDERDGFVHLSSPAQVRETARLHFAPKPGAPAADLVLVALDPTRLRPGTLRWEPSRGGALFPHVYGDVPLDAIVGSCALPWDGERFVFPSELPLTS